MTAARPALSAWAMLAALALPAMAACGEQVPAAPKPGAEQATRPRAQAVNFERETAAFAFTYAYPAQAAALTGLAALLEADRVQKLAQLEDEAAEAQKDAQGNDYPFNPHMMSVSWNVTGENDRMLAMMGEISTFSGGAHGNTSYEALLWDKAAAKRITLSDVFTDAAAALEPLRQPYCESLKADRLEKRGDSSGESDDMFNACPPFSDLVLVPFAGGSAGFDRMIITAAPYVAGPYVEGAYESSLALPAATLDQVKPQYRAAFSSGE